MRSCFKDDDSEEEVLDIGSRLRMIASTAVTLDSVTRDASSAFSKEASSSVTQEPSSSLSVTPDASAAGTQDCSMAGTQDLAAIDHSIITIGLHVIVTYMGSLYKATIHKFCVKTERNEVQVHCDGNRKTTISWISMDDIPKILEKNCTNVYWK